VSPTPLKVAVFASGGGTNFQALLDHGIGHDLWTVVLLIQNREAGAAERARAAGIPVRIIPTKDRDDADVGAETLDALGEHDVDIVLLAGYLRRIPAAVTERYAGRILNIHPALLPDFGGRGMYGMNVHRAVVEAGVDVTGATVHFCNAVYDDGDILGQWQVHVVPGDTPEQVAQRVLHVEHQLYPRAVDHLAKALRRGRLVERMPDVRLQEPPEPRRPIQLPENDEEST